MVQKETEKWKRQRKKKKRDPHLKKKTVRKGKWKTWLETRNRLLGPKWKSSFCNMQVFIHGCSFQPQRMNNRWNKRRKRKSQSFFFLLYKMPHGAWTILHNISSRYPHLSLSILCLENDIWHLFVWSSNASLTLNRTLEEWRGRVQMLQPVKTWRGRTPSSEGSGSEFL